MESGHRYRPMTIVDEEKGSGELAREGKKGKEVAQNGHLKANGHQVSVVKPPRTRATQHGSFDFERPGWSGSVARSTSGGSANTAATSPRTVNQSRESLTREPMNTGSLQKSLSLNSPERGTGNDNAIDTRRQHVKRAASPTAKADINLSRSVGSASHARPPAAGVELGLSSSLGRKTGKRALGSGIARLIGISHGPFAFEPPVPSPTASNMSVSTKGSAVGRFEISNEKERRERDKVQEARARDEEKQREKDRKKAARRTAHVFVPAIVETATPVVNHGFRSGTKGRSLDLGLGLSWAPTKMREDAFLSSSLVFGKDGSASSRNGLARKADTRDVAADRSKVGKEVADAFRSALDEEGYTTFKNCGYH